MSYYFSKVVNKDFDTAILTVSKALKKEGFGILTEIDVQQTLGEKLDVNFRKYKILGACNPQLAYEALLTEGTIGTMLPCNVIVQEQKNGQIEVAAVDPVASMKAIENNHLHEIAIKVRKKLKKVILQL